MLEFGGELLCVDYVIRVPKSVIVLSMQVGDGVRPRWVESDGDHLCLFLSFQGSLAVDAREYAGSTEVTGGCAFFVSRHPKFTVTRPLYGVYKYSFRNGKVTLVAELRTFFDKIPMWFIPRPRMPPLWS